MKKFNIEDSQDHEYPLNVEKIIQHLDDNKACNICVIDVSKKCQFTDWLIFATGNSNRHVKAIAEKLEFEQKKARNTALSSEGYRSCEWILIDFFDVVVHIMQQSVREYYDLEKMWMTDIKNNDLT